MASGCARQKVTLGHNFFFIEPAFPQRNGRNQVPDIFAPIRVGTPWDTEPPAPCSDAIRGHMEIGREVIWRLGAHMLPTQSHLLLRIRHLTPGVGNPLPLTNHTSTLLAGIRIDFKPVLFNSIFMLSRRINLIKFRLRVKIIQCLYKTQGRAK